MLVGYMRVSSTTDRQTTDLQLDALTAAGVDPRHIYTDHCSGATDQRPGLAQMKAFIGAGDVVLVWRLDRLGRSLSNLLEWVRYFQDQGVGFRSLTEQIDTTTAMGTLILHLFGALAEYERSLTQERIMAGVAAACSRGRVGGRPRTISDQRLRAIKADLTSGATMKSVCHLYGVKRTTLIEALNRQKGA